MLNSKKEQEMKSKKNILTVFILGLLMALASCQKLDDIVPLNQLTEDNVIRDQKSAQAVLNKLYNITRSSNVSQMAANLNFYGLEAAIPGLPYSENNVMDDDISIDAVYTEMYNLINTANFLIEQLEAGKATDLDETGTNEMLAQGKTMRAMAHLHLLRLFGQFYDMDSKYGVVVNLKPVRGAEEKARSTVADTYQAIIDDLSFAAEKGPTNLDRTYMNAIFSKALLAKVQLYSGDYTNAALNASEVISGFNLADNSYQDVFTKRWESTEALYAPFVDGDTEADTWSGNNHGGFGFFISPYFRELGDISDGTDDNILNPFDFDSGYDARFTYALGSATMGPNFNGKYPYERINANKTQGNTFYYLRMAEVFLIHAEAEARRVGGDLTTALASLNDVRDRVAMPQKSLSDKATLLTHIREEKMLELFAETGESWFDLARYYGTGDLTMADLTALKSSITGEDKLTLPIPVAALGGNTLLEKNP